MTTDRLSTILLPLCAGVDEDIVRDFLARMDPDYFERFQPGDIARHIALVGRLDPEHPCQVAVTTAPEDLFNVVVVAYDYFSEFATICGLLSSYGLDIREGGIYTFADATDSSGPAPSPDRTFAALRRRPRKKTGLTRKK
ncbi:MAG: hypothetical protein FJ246_12165, partial [Nitrospira sp.]|nr:hypothetical protein [Nitrospira sp.]